MHAANAPRDVRVAFITVDPKRDTAAALKRYVRVFDPSFRGHTGTERALDGVYAPYHVGHEAIPVHHGPNDYSVAHGTTIYDIGRDGSMKGFGHAPVPAS